MSNVVIAHESYSKRIHKAFNKKSMRRHVSAILYIGLMSIYLVWRLTTLNQNHLTVSLLYYAAEVIGFILGLVVVFNSWRISSNNIVNCPTHLTVDVFIPTYKEDIAIIRKTLEAARDITYSHNTWVLDDAKREDVKRVAQELNIKYIVREHNTHAKAGNLNNAITQSHADFIAVFDADHIPQPEALEKLLGYFENEKVAMVQTPQDYYNTDAYQYMNPKNRPGYWHDQSFFYNIALASSDIHNACSCVGTGVIYRRTALDAIGGIPTETVTEDIHTSLKLHKAGYRTIYVNDPVAYGLAATDLTEYYLTRHRWAHGNLSALKIENVLFCSGLDWKQRLSYLSLGLIYLEGWQQLILFIIPIFALVFGIPPFDISLLNVLIIFLFPFITYLLLQEIGGGFTRFWTNEIYSMIRWPIHIAASSALFGKKIKWQSSKKNIKGTINAMLMLPQMTVLVLSLVALGFAGYMVWNNTTIGPLGQLVINLFTHHAPMLSTEDFTKIMDDGYSIELVMIAGAWALFNIIKVIAFIVKTVNSSLASDSELFFNLQLPIIVENKPAINTVKISEQSAVISYTDINGIKKVNAVSLVLPTGLLTLNVEMHVIDDHHCRVVFQWASRAEQLTLIKVLYSPNWYRDAIVRDTLFLTPVDFLINILKWLIGRESKRYKWTTAVLNSAQAHEQASLCLIGQCGDHYSLLCFQACEVGMRFLINGMDIVPPKHIVIMAHQSIASSPSKGLYGKQYYRYKIRIIE